jgi:hypothetical protein
MIARSILPLVAVGTVGYDLALSWRLVCFDNVFNNGNDLVVLELWRPIQIPCRVVDARMAGVTDTLHGMPQKGTRDAGTSSEKEWICSMAKVVSSSANLGAILAHSIAWRCRKPKPLSCHGLTGSFKADYGPAVSCADKTANRAAKGMTDHPDVGVWINLGYILV